MINTLNLTHEGLDKKGIWDVPAPSESFKGGELFLVFVSLHEIVDDKLTDACEVGVNGLVEKVRLLVWWLVGELLLLLVVGLLFVRGNVLLGNAVRGLVL